MKHPEQNIMSQDDMLAHMIQNIENIRGEKERVIKNCDFEGAFNLRDAERKLEQDIKTLKTGKAYGLRYNDGKLKWSYVDWKSLEPMVRVLMFGAQKYEPFNWQKGLNKTEILESMMRHLAALIDGEMNDPESGLPHMGHIQCNAMFYQYMVNKKEKKESETELVDGSF